MFIPFVFILGYTGDYDHISPFYKYLTMASRNRWPMIAHERYFNSLELMNSVGITEETRHTLCDFFKCDAPKQQDLDAIAQYKIPEMFEQELLGEFSSRIDAWMFLMQHNYQPLEDLLDSMLADISQKFEEPIEGIVCYFAPESLRRVAEKRSIPLFFNEGGPIRPPAYHSLFMYMGRDGLQVSSPNAENRYKQFLHEISKISKFPLLSREEILMLLLDEKFYKDIPLINSPPAYEIGILHQAFLSMFSVQHTHMTNHELTFIANKLYSPSQIITRGHPNHGMQTDGTTSFHFLCKCRRIAGVTANMPIEALMLGRIACVYSRFQFSFMCNKGMNDPNAQPAPLEFVNFLVFCNYIPLEWMADENHLRFLASNPSEVDIFFKAFSYMVRKNPKLKRKYLKSRNTNLFKKTNARFACCKKFIFLHNK